MEYRIQNPEFRMETAHQTTKNAVGGTPTAATGTVAIPETGCKDAGPEAGAPGLQQILCFRRCHAAATGASRTVALRRKITDAVKASLL